MHRVVSSGLLTDSPAEGLFSLDGVVRKLFSLPRKAVALYHDDMIWEALWQATLQTYQGVRHASQGRPRGEGAPFAAAAAARQRQFGAPDRVPTQSAVRAPRRQAGASPRAQPNADSWCRGADTRSARAPQEPDVVA